MSFDNDINIMDSIEACRTCGVFFLTSSSFLRQIFTSAVEDPEMLHIRMELTAWNIEINENDGYPQFICTGCIHEFQKVFKFRRSCVDIQDQLRHFYNVRSQNQNQIQIKTELPDIVEDTVSDFIYVDDLSDTEYDGATPCNIPHVPIKEEMYEAAVPVEPIEEAMDSANTNIDSDNMEPPSSNITNEMECPMIQAEDIENSNLDEDINSVRTADIDAAQIQTGNEVATPASTSFVKCEFCNCISPNMQLHKLHMKRIHEIRDMECHICGKKFKNSSSTRLKFHLKWHKISKHIKCAQCGYYCNSRDMLREHTRQMHSKVNCSVCGKNVLSKRMKSHMRSHGLDTLFECTYCSKVFTTSAAVSTHISQAHTAEAVEGGQDRNVENTCVELGCAICDQKFINQIDLKVHVEEKHLSDASDLNKCGDEYSLMYSTNNTVATENCNDFQESSFSVADDERGQIFCPNCHQNFFNPDELAEHVAQCQQYVENESEELYHSGYNGVKNEYIDNYQNQDQLMQENVYEDDQDYGVVPLPDDEVEKSADTDEGIDETENYQLHTFGCAQCTDTFDNVEQLRDHHEKSHPKKSNFKCHVCDKVFELKFSLNRHMKKHENI